jgi:hypothetical protein
MRCRRRPEGGRPSADRATRPVQMSFHVGRDGSFPTTGFRQLLHQAEQAVSGCSRLRFGLHSAKLRNDHVVNRNFHASARISPDPADQRRQPLACFSDRKFHDRFRLNRSEMYSHVQFMSTHSRLQQSYATPTCRSMPLPNRRRDVVEHTKKPPRR